MHLTIVLLVYFGVRSIGPGAYVVVLRIHNLH